MPASLCDHCADVSDVLSWSLSRVHLYCLCSSSDQATNVSDAQNTRTNYFTYLEQESVILLLWELRQLQRRYLCRNTETQREPNKHRRRQTDGNPSKRQFRAPDFISVWSILVDETGNCRRYCTASCSERGARHNRHVDTKHKGRKMLTG
jgi:hypothetical protein